MRTAVARRKDGLLIKQEIKLVFVSPKDSHDINLFPCVPGALVHKFLLVRPVLYPRLECF